jgi:excisionase family DNA binding protein
MDEEKMYSVKEVSALLGWSPDTIRRLIYRGHLMAIQLPVEGRRRKRIYRSARIRARDIRLFLDRNKVR